MAQTFDAIVLAGGQARRLGGRDKAALDVAGRSSLDRVLDALRDAERIVIVGVERAVDRRVTWCREDPPYAGPPAGVAAALPHLSSPHGSSRVVVLLACDAPLVDAGTIGRVVASVGPHDAAWLVDDGGNDQYLAGAYRRSALEGVRSARSLRAAFADLDVVRVPDPAGVARDMDDWDAVVAVRSAAGGQMLKEWTSALARELGVDPDIDERLLLEVARDAAHSVARPAAPLTTFLVGYAAAKAGGGPEAIAQASATAQRLAAGWAGEPDATGSG